MAVRNTELGGSDWTEEGLKPTDINDTFDEVAVRLPKVYQDTTGGSHSGDSTETTVATATITQNDLSDNSTIFSVASIKVTSGAGSGSNNSIYRLKVGGVTIDQTNIAGDTSTIITIGGCVSGIATGIDNTAGNTIVTITAQHGGTNTTNVMTCENLSVIAWGI